MFNGNYSSKIPSLYRTIWLILLFCFGQFQQNSMGFNVDPSSLSDYGNMGSTSTNVISNISLPPYRPSMSSQAQQQQQIQPSFFETRFGCGVNASPESAISPSISSVATSGSEVSKNLFLFYFFLYLLMWQLIVNEFWWPCAYLQ